MSKPVIRIAITGGAGNIAYSLLFRIASGEMLGQDQPIALHVLEIPAAFQALEGVKMELEDSAFPLLKDVVIGTDPFEVFQDVHYAMLVGAKPRGPGMERADLLQENGKIFIEQGKALNDAADKDVKVLVVGNPCNTNCLIAMANAPRIPRSHFHAMMRLDHNRGIAQLAAKADVDVGDVTDFVIWGNHSTTQVPDYTHAKIKGRPAAEVIDDRKWLEEDFMTQVQKRGAAIIAARGKSSAASAASAAIDAMRALHFPTPADKWFSNALYSHGNPYGIDSDLIFSFPCRSLGKGRVEIVGGLAWSKHMEEKIRRSEKELQEERQMVANILEVKHG